MSDQTAHTDTHIDTDTHGSFELSQGQGPVSIGRGEVEGGASLTSLQSSSDLQLTALPQVLMKECRKGITEQPLNTATMTFEILYTQHITSASCIHSLDYSLLCVLVKIILNIFCYSSCEDLQRWIIGD